MMFLRVLLILFISSFIISCNEKETDNSTKTIKFWNFWSEPYQKEALEPLIKKFEADNKCVVETSELLWSDGKKKLMAAFNSGTAPDVLELGSDWVAQFSSGGVLLELDPVEMEIDKYISYSTKPCYWNNKLYTIPWIVDTRILFCNVELMEQAGINDFPGTIDDLIIASQMVNDIDGKYGFGANGADRHRLYKKLVTMFWTYGGDIFDDIGRPIINSKQNIEGLKKYLELANTGIVESQKQIDNLFAQGKVGFWISGAWLIEKIQNVNHSLNYKLLVIPGSGLNPGISFAGGEYFAVSKKSENPELAKKFIKYITDGKNSIEFCKLIMEAGFPADKNYYKDEYYQTHELRQTFSEQLEFAKMTPVHPKWLEIEAILEDYAVETLYLRMTPEMALNKAQEKVRQLLR